MAYVRFRLSYKKIYYNWETGKSEKCTFCYPRIEAVNRRSVRKPVSANSLSGVLLYDADRIEAAASCESEKICIKISWIFFSIQ